MLFLYLFGVSLWLAYGLLIHATAITLTNAATLLLIAVATGLKAWTARREALREAVSIAAVEPSK
jgi:uncharacterized protein with PQ loop repeat